MCRNHIGSATNIVWKDGKLNVQSFNLPCNKWDCPECAKKKSIILGNRVKEGFKGERIRFATFTDAGKGSLSQRLQTLKTAWNRLRLELVRHYGLTKFFWVLEFGGKGGRPHLHCLLNCYVPQHELSRLAERCGFGSITDIRIVKNGGGFGYVFKYLSKDCGLRAGAGALKAIKGRRFGVSRTIPPAPKAECLKQCAIFQPSVCSSAGLRERTYKVASTIGQGIQTVKAGGALEKVQVSKPAQQWECGATAPLYPLVVPTFQHLNATAHDVSTSNTCKWAWNSRVKLCLQNVSIEDPFRDWEKWSGLDVMNPRFFEKIAPPDVKGSLWT